MAEVQFANLGNALAAGSQAGAMSRASAREDEAEKRRIAVQPDVAAAVGGDDQAFGRVAAADPRTAAALAPVLARLDARQAAKVKEAADYTVGVGMGILNAPQGSRAQLYEAAKADAATRGMDTSSWPASYDEGWLKFNIGKAIPAKTWFEEQGKNARKGAGGGGGSSLEPLGGGAMPSGVPAPAPAPRAPGPMAAVVPPAAPAAPTASPPVQVAGMPGEGVPQGDNVPTADGSGNPLPPAQAPLGKFWPTDPALQGGVMMQDRKRPGVPAEQNGHFIYKLPNGEIVLHKPRDPRPARQYPPGFEENPDGGGLRPIVGGPADPNTVRRLNIPPGFQPSPDGGLAPIPGGPADPEVIARTADARRKAEEKAIPGTVTKGMQENLTALKKLDQALTELDSPNAKGSVGGVGGNVASWLPGGADFLNWVDPDGTKVRALIADIGSLKIHDRSGAAVTAAETPRLKPFVPSIGDSPRVIRDKLANFRAEYEGMLRDATDYYGPANGFREYSPATNYLNGKEAAPAQGPAEKARDEFNAKKNGGTVKVQTPDEAMKLPSGTVFETPDGRVKVRP